MSLEGGIGAANIDAGRHPGKHIPRPEPVSAHGSRYLRPARGPGFAPGYMDI
jgi:hypothetical protein